MIKLAYISATSCSPSETFIYDLVKRLNSEPKIELTFISGSNEEFKTDFKLNVIPTRFAEKHTQWAYILKKIGQLKGENGDYAKFKFQQWVAKRALNKANLSNFDLAYIEYATGGVLAMNSLMQKGIPFIVHVHGFDVTTTLNDKAFHSSLNNLFQGASYIITPSHHLKRVLICLGCPPQKIIPIFPVTNIETIEPIDWKKNCGKDPSISFLGRLTPKKNPLALLEAFKLVINQIPNAHLNILGDGPLLPEVKARIIQLGLSNNVRLFGIVNREAAFKILNSSWVYAQHSVTAHNGDQEGFPVSLAEAAAHALPIVSTIHSGITENVVDGKTGFLVQEYNFEQMAEKIIFLIKNPKIAKEMGLAGRQHILELCGGDVRLKEIKKVIFSTINRTSTRIK